ncbi:MAG: hypothetical protein KJ593_05525 [Candidatus Omnitrophica bacterium]|nr:hypothetical protein [Candidatus Omnitrophota bacterium]
MKRMRQPLKSLFYNLASKYKYFCRKRMLESDGSFYYDDKRLAEEEFACEATIGRQVADLLEIGLIKCTRGRWKTEATKYWILVQPNKLLSFIQQRKANKNSSKDNKMSSIGQQNVTPNKEINKEIKYIDNQFSSEKEIKEGVRGIIKVSGSKKARSFYVDRGYDGKLIDKILEEIDDEALNSNKGHKSKMS